MNNARSCSVQHPLRVSGVDLGGWKKPQVLMDAWDDANASWHTIAMFTLILKVSEAEVCYELRRVVGELEINLPFLWKLEIIM